MFHDIGEAAGAIWKLLSEGGPLSISAIVNKTRKPRNTVYMGIGWLAREDKLVFKEGKQGIYLSLKK